MSVDSPTQATPPRPWIRLVLLWFVPALVVAVAIAYWLNAQAYASTDNAYVKAEKTIVAAEVDGRVREVRVAENTRVTRGTPLIEIDDEALRNAVNRLRARVDVARVQVSGLKAEYAQKQAALAGAVHAQAFAQREFERQKELSARRLIAAARLDDAAQSADAANARVAIAQREVATLAARLGGRADLPLVQSAEVRTAEAELAQAELDLRHALVLAPRDGIVSKLPQVGDHLARGAPALAIVSERNVWIEANFKETDLRGLRIGMPVDIRIDTYGQRPWRGRVQSIAQATGAEYAILPPQNATGNWVKVVQRIAVRIEVLPENDAPPLRAGMSASVKIDTRSPAGDRSASVAESGS
jgi:membrane fusion protein (multidrug efflux system)